MTTTLITTGLDVIFGALSIATAIIGMMAIGGGKPSDVVCEKSISPSTSRENHAQQDAVRVRVVKENIDAQLSY